MQNTLEMFTNFEGTGKTSPKNIRQLPLKSIFVPHLRAGPPSVRLPMFSPSPRGRNAHCLPLIPSLEENS